MGKSTEIQQHTDKYTLFGAIDPTTGEIKPVSMADLPGGIAVVQYVWDTTLMQWVKMQQPVLEADDLTVTMGDVEKLLADNYWHDTRYEFAGNNPLYIGKNTTHDESTAAATWFIWKYSFSGNNPTRKEGPLVGSWDGRAGLGWA